MDENTMEAFLRNIMEGKASMETLSKTKQVERLNEEAKFRARTNPFEVGDLVTPRKGTNVKGRGHPHKVIAKMLNPSPVWEGSPASNAYGMTPDIRVIAIHTGAVFAHWVESADFEPYVAKES